MREAYNAAQDVMAALDAVQETVDAAAVRLHDALAHPADETQSTGPDDSSSNGSTEPDSIAPGPTLRMPRRCERHTGNGGDSRAGVRHTVGNGIGSRNGLEASQGCRSTAAPTLLLLIALAAAPLRQQDVPGGAGKERSEWVGGLRALRCVSCFCLPPAVSGQQLRTDGVRMRGRLRTASSRGRNAMSAHSRTAVLNDAYLAFAGTTPGIGIPSDWAGWVSRTIMPPTRRLSGIGCRNAIGNRAS